MKTTLKLSALVWLLMTALSLPLLADNEEALNLFRHKQLQDENGQVPPDGWIFAETDRNAMPITQENWLEFWNPDVNSPYNWVPIGPGNIGGKVRSFIVHPNFPNLMWTAGVGGGVWKTVNGGQKWSTNTDFQGNINVSCMAFDRKTYALYYGTGGDFTLQGKGIYKSTDLGQTWATLPSTENNSDFVGVNRLSVSPTDPNIILAGTTTGLLGTLNQGATWVRRDGITTEIYDVVFHPTDGSKALASGRNGDVYYSDDKGQHWTNSQWIVRPPGVGTVKLAYAKSNPLIVYANTQDTNGQLYRSGDGGRSFIPRGSTGTTVLPQANTLWVDPVNSNKVVFGGSTLFRSRDGGTTREFAYTPHDSHLILTEQAQYNGTTNSVVFCGTAGGVYKTNDIWQSLVPQPPFPASQVVWTSLNNDLGVTQFIGAAGNKTSGTIIGGTRDNGALRLQPGREWAGFPAYGDGGFCAADQTDPNYFYGESTNLSIYRSTDGAVSAQYIGYNLPACVPLGTCTSAVAPFVLDPNNPNVILAGGSSLWRTTNAKAFDPHQILWPEIKGPVHGGALISAIAVAAGKSDVIWVGYTDGSVYYTVDGSKYRPRWSKVSGLPQRMVTRIAITGNGLEPVGTRDVYITFGGFTSGNIWRTNGDWISFIDISGPLPRLPIFTVVTSPVDPGRVYIGTELGVFASGNRGQRWSPGRRGPANTAVTELFWMNDRTLVAATFGRGVFTLGPTDH